MNGLYIYKTLAYANELRTVKSSEDEFQEFLMGVARPDFADKDVICIRFLFSLIPECLDDVEETSWIINPNSVKAPPYCIIDSFGAKLPNDYPPYLVLLASEYPENNLLKMYDDYFVPDSPHACNWKTDYFESYKAFNCWAKENL